MKGLAGEGYWVNGVGRVMVAGHDQMNTSIP